MLYYDWILTDPGDSPFVSFSFHYRSWENLGLLNFESNPSDFSQGRNEPSSPGFKISPSKATIATSGADRWWLGGQVIRTADRLRTHHLQDHEHAHTAPHSEETSRALQAIASCSYPPQTLEREHTHLQGFSEKDAGAPPRKSTDSAAPSITPSLLPYIEEDSASTDDIECGTATEVPVLWDHLLGMQGKRQLPQPPQLMSSSSSLDGISPPSYVGSSL